MSSHSDSFVKSGNSPGSKRKRTFFVQIGDCPDFLVENHDSIFLLRPLTLAAESWIDEHIGQDNGYQPYWPTVVVERRYISDILDGNRDDELEVYVEEKQWLN